MDNTSRPTPMDISEDSGCLTGSFEQSSIPFESTPNYNRHPEVIFTSSTLQKRKVSQTEFLSSHNRLENISETCPSPKFCSTLNESLLHNVENISITPSFYVERKELQFEDESFKSKMQSTPATPIKQLITDIDKPHAVKPNESPCKEILDIVYSVKPPVVQRKSVTPQKYGSSSSKRFYSPMKRRLFDYSGVALDPIKYFKGHNLILSRIFSFMRGIDLCRMKRVSKSWSNAIDRDRYAIERYNEFLEKRRRDKENRSLTPPGTPPSPDSPPVSPGSRTFHRFTKLAQKLCPGQSLHHCPSCDGPSVVEQDIGQCQNLSCLYIFCLNCNSYSNTGPEDFHNKCDKAQLMLPKKQKLDRFELSDLSNSGSFSSFLGVSRTESSGYVSQPNTPLEKVKRNLRKSCGDKPLVASNTNTSRGAVPKRKLKPHVIPVVSGTGKGTSRAAGAAAASKAKFDVGSEQSKKRLRRLLF